MAAPEAPVRLIDGATQVLTVPNAGNVTSAAVGSQTYAVRLSVITGNCLVRITHAGTAATVSRDSTTHHPRIDVEGSRRPVAMRTGSRRHRAQKGDETPTSRPPYLWPRRLTRRD